MRKVITRMLALLLFSIGIVIVLAIWKGGPYAEMASAYKAKTLCSAVFVSGRDVDSEGLEDVSSGELSFLNYFQAKIDRDKRVVTVSFFGFNPSVAVYREGIGVTLAVGKSVDELLAEPAPVVSKAPRHLDRLWPEGEAVALDASVPDVDREKLDQVVDSAFAGNNPLNTRAVVVVYHGRIVAEKYAPGFNAEMPLKGWSMAKGVTNALTGILVRRGKLSLEQNHLLQAWSSENDPRRQIALDHMLRMSSGLDFNEDYTVDPQSDISMMLYRSGDASGYASTKPLVQAPGTVFEYASGTSNLICEVIREVVGDDVDYHSLPYRELFHPIGAYSAILERDASGTFVGSSFIYATARDWARIGLLYANDGVWNGNRILPEGWVDYSRTPASADPKGEHGAHLWVKIQGREDRPELPAGIFHMAGHEGQFVSILPEQKVVVVRLGFTLQTGAWDQELFVSNLLEAIH